MNIKKQFSAKGFELIVASFLILFQELILIRWLGTQVRVLAYFPNLILIAAFLGIGVGCLRTGKRSLLFTWPLSLIIITISTYFFSKIIFTQEDVSDHLWLLYYSMPKDSLVIKDIYLPIIFYFTLVSFSFVALGQIVGNRLEIFKQESKVLWGYSLDITGSILGVLAFTLFSYLGTFPLSWFILLLTIGLIFYLHNTSYALAYLAFALITLISVSSSEKFEIYSPYYAINVNSKNPEMVEIETNGSLHQIATKLDYPPASTSSDVIQLIANGYHRPYQGILKNDPEKVLILGAGTGNDVATALINNAKQIDVVEIDPEIIKLGEKYHPNKPYSSERVRVFNTDARSYLNSTKEKYDLIVFGTLDSMTRLSALSSVRLDNFVYTRESLKSARNLLSKDGGLILMFMVGKPHIAERLQRMLSIEFQQSPLIYFKYHYLFNYAFMNGPAFDHIKGKERTKLYQQQTNLSGNQIKLATDDWPFLYLENPSISSFYQKVIFSIILIAVIMLSFASSLKVKLSNTNITLFLFGLSFLLLETKAVTTMNLVWGATWLTSAVVFGSILLMVLLATLLSAVKKLNINLAFSCLFASLLTLYFIPIELLTGLNTYLKLIASIFVIGLPIFSASIVFAIIFSDSKLAGESFGWNILGAVVGGLLEFLSMITGLKALLLCALIPYLLAFMLQNKKTV